MSKFIAMFITVVGAMLLSAALFALVTQWAWNTVMPDVFGLPAITTLQAFALNLLAGLLLKSNTVHTGH